MIILSVCALGNKTRATTVSQGYLGNKSEGVPQKINKSGNDIYVALASKIVFRKTVISKPVYKALVLNNALEKVINSKKIYSATAYFIWIDIYHQKVNIFKGSYKKWHLITSMVCSTGKASTPTIKGDFSVGSKGSYFISSGGARCKYYTQISGNYLFHSVLYDRKGNYILDNTLGVPVSHGCVRLALKNAKFIYDYIPARTFIWSN